MSWRCRKPRWRSRVAAKWPWEVFLGSKLLEFETKNMSFTCFLFFFVFWVIWQVNLTISCHLFGNLGKLDKKIMGLIWKIVQKWVTFHILVTSWSYRPFSRMAKFTKWTAFLPVGIQCEQKPWNRSPQVCARMGPQRRFRRRIFDGGPSSKAGRKHVAALLRKALAPGSSGKAWFGGNGKLAHIVDDLPMK